MGCIFQFHSHPLPLNPVPLLQRLWPILSHSRPPTSLTFCPAPIRKIPQWTFTRDGNSLLQSEPKKSTFISFYLHFYFTGVLRVVSFSCSHWGPGVQASILQRELRRIKSAFLQRGGRPLLWPLLSPKLGGFRSRPPQEEPLMVS